METDDGGKISLNVAQYVSFDLSQDGLTFAQPLYNQILAEAVEQSRKTDFKAEPYFCNHPDLQVSQIATRLAVDRHQLGGRFEIDSDETDEDKRRQKFLARLRQRVLHLVMDFRLDIVESKLKEIQRELQQVGGSTQRMMELLNEHKETKEIRDELAKRLGSDLVV